MRLIRVTLLFTLPLLTLASCDKAPALHKFSGAAQGTTYSLTYWSDKKVEQAQFEAAIAGELQRLDKLMSNYRDDSVIEQFNLSQSTAPIEVGTEIVRLVSIAKTISAATAGCYDPTIRPLFTLWGFHGKQLTIPDAAQLAELAPQLGISKVDVINNTSLQKLQPKLSIDLSSIAQGYSVQRLTEVAEQFGIDNYLIEIGGELQTRGNKPDGSQWRVAIERPLPGTQQLQKIVQVKQTAPLAIMTSGTYRHYYDNDGKRYSHILDARSKAPVTHDTVSVTLLHNDLTEADAWSTALLCLGSEQGSKVAGQFNLAVLFIDQTSNGLTELHSSALQQHAGVMLVDAKLKQ
ncbi:MAG: FAD:protein FMN transferase [Gammaproteobacteria bacterium HGW-Gammaproteobacteria-15]|nr:MAG: FAD:protein FMN transferase [Gammaproteobacteria bacterium HGW-Gammaproteobacteria-15]